MHLQAVALQLRQVFVRARLAVLLKDFLKVHKDPFIFTSEFVKKKGLGSSAACELAVFGILG